MTGVKIWMIKNQRTGEWQPLNDHDRETSDKIPSMEEALFVMQRPRNSAFHRKYFAMLKIVFDNQEQFKNQEHLRHYLQMKAGFVDIVATPNGTMHLPSSIAYDKMDATQFEDLYEKVLVEVLSFINLERETLEQELSQFV